MLIYILQSKLLLPIISIVLSQSYQRSSITTIFKLKFWHVILAQKCKHREITLRTCARYERRHSHPKRDRTKTHPRHLFDVNVTPWSKTKTKTPVLSWETLEYQRKIFPMQCRHRLTHTLIIILPTTYLALFITDSVTQPTTFTTTLKQLTTHTTHPTNHLDQRDDNYEFIVVDF